MTFTTIVQQVMDRLNLSSPEARDRIGAAVNQRYKMSTSSIGVETSRRKIVTMTLDPNEVGNILPDLEVEGIEKVLKVTLPIDGQRIRVLKQLTFDELTNIESVRALPRAWAVKYMGSQTSTITFDSVALDPIEATIEGYDLTDVLADDAQPFMPEDFHDLLVEGAMSDELRKMEKPQLAQISEQRYEQRLSDLRMFIAKNAYLDIIQGKDKPNQLWYRPWYSRTSMWN